MQKIEKDIAAIKAAVVERRIERFSMHDVVLSFFGAFLFGLSSVFNGMLPVVVEHLSYTQVGLIIVATILVLVFEIYFIGWHHAGGEKGRNAFEFTLKRLAITYFASFLIATFLITLFGFYNILGLENVIKMIFVLCMPCATGAVLADVVKKY